jgi:UDP-3-O-[3-hydroxymyristoyl] glucosamine N-acyltransferase
LVERFGGQLVGDPNLEVQGIAPLDSADASHISFLSNSKLRALAAQSRAAALIVAPLDDATVAATYEGARIVTTNPYAYFARAAQYFAALEETPKEAGVHPTASVHESARIDPSAHIGPHVTVEAGATIGADAVIDAGCFVGRDAEIGEGTHLFANVTFHARCRNGKRGILHSGAVIGTDGFGFARDNGVYIKIPQTGRVMLGDDVDVGANTAMAGCVGVAGSAKIGKNCTFGGAAMVLGHLEIVDNVHISSGSMVSRSVLEPGQYTGFYPLAKNSEWERSAAIVRNLSSMREKIRTLEKQIKTLTDKAEEK